MNRSFLALTLLFSSCAYAWNATGHHIVAQIAYDNLSPKVKRQVNAMNRAFSPRSHSAKFVWAASWADRLRGGPYKIYENWHYIDVPYTTDGSPVDQPVMQNALWAVTHTRRAFLDPELSPHDQSFNFRFYIHIVGDLHQPLHCIDRFSREHPQGDRGGNSVLIDSKYGKNLHQYWDRGAGYFEDQYPYRRWTAKQLRTVARRIEQEFPKSSLATEASILEPYRWSEESNRLAREKVYQLHAGEAPSPDYQQESREIIKRQLALAGYRLAASLNQAFATSK